MPDVKDMAARLMQAEWDRATIAPFSDADLGIDIEAAYAAQWAFVQSKLDADDKLIGVKLGLTSWAKQEAMGVTEPLYGWITSGMIAGAGQPVDRQSLIQPRGAGDRLPAGPRRHRARDRHQRPGRHQRPSSPRWISSTPGTATTVSPCRTSSPTMPARDGSCSPPGPPTWSTCGWSAAYCERGGPWRPRRRGRSWSTRQSRWLGWPTASAHAVSACARDGWCCPVASPRRCRSNRARPSPQNWTGWVRWRSTAAGGHSVSSWRRLVRVSSISSDPCPDRMVRVAYKVKPLIWP